jgi:tetratricopeptide (TPR) repeat protein
MARQGQATIMTKGDSVTAVTIKTLILDLLQQGHHDEVAWMQDLTETESEAIGTPHLWSAKDHVIHWMFGRQNLIQVLRAILHQQEIPSREKINDDNNEELFAELRLRPWPEIQTESEHIYADLIALIEKLSENDMMDDHRFTPAFWNADADGQPLYTAFLGYCYEHGQEHLVQYYSDRNNLIRAIELRKQCANRILQAEVPEWIKGWFLYNLASFYAEQNQLKEANIQLQEAITYNARLKELAKREPALSALSEQLE